MSFQKYQRNSDAFQSQSDGYLFHTNLYSRPMNYLDDHHIDSIGAIQTEGADVTFIAFLIFVFSMPIEGFMMLTPTIGITELLGILVFGLFLCSNLVRREMVKTDLNFCLIIVFLTWAAFSVYWASYPDQSLRRLLTLIECSALYLLVVNLLIQKNGFSQH